MKGSLAHRRATNSPTSPNYTFQRNAMAFPPLHIQQRVADVHLQHLALHLDGPDEHPDLILAERLRVGCGELLQLFGHRRVLVGGHLELQAGAFPGVLQGSPIAERPQVVHGVRQQQAQPGHVLRLRVRLELLDLLSQLRASHTFMRWFDHGSRFSIWKNWGLRFA
jgi:hypothetical protein